MLVLWKKILKLAIPSIATFSSMTLTGMITLILIGRLGPLSIAVVGISNIVMYNCWALISGIGGALNYLVAQNFGEGNMKHGNQRMQISILLSVSISLLLLLSSLILPYFIFVLLGASPDVVQAGAPFLRVRLYAFAFSIITNVYFAYMRGIGDTKTPMFISILSNACLILLTYAWTYGHFGLPQMGLAGAAWSLFLTELLSLLLSLWVYYRRYHDQFQTRSWLPITFQEAKFIFKESLKLSGMEFSMSLGMLIFTGCITRLGTSAIAANEIALNILSLGFMPANGFGAAATIAVGQEIGAGNHQEAKRAGIHTVLIGTCFMCLFSLFLLLFASEVARFYTTDVEVSNITTTLLRIAACIQLFDGVGIIVGGGLRGIGDTTFLFRMSLLLNWIVFVPLTLLFTLWLHWGQNGAWLALCTLIVLIGVANGWRYLRIKWSTITPNTANG